MQDFNPDVTSLTHIEAATLRYVKAREAIAKRVAAVQDLVNAIHRTHLTLIRQAVGKATQEHEALKHLIESNPQLFDKPKTHTFHGVKVGFRKGAGGIEFDDADHVVELIEKHFPELADTLVKTTKKPIKKALENLEVRDLKKIGCCVEETGDVVVIKPVDGAVDKIVAALLKEATEDLEKEAA